MATTGNLVEIFAAEAAKRAVADGKIYQQICILILRDQAAEALPLLNEVEMTNPIWYYMKALVHFKLSGDDLVSRAALRHACAVDAELGQMFSDSFENELDHDERFEIPFIESVKRVWLYTEGAKTWLADMITGKTRLSCKHSDECEIDVDDFRIKRWKHNFEMAETFTYRSEFKEAIKHLNMALKEAEKFGVANWRMQAVLEQLIPLLNHIDASTDKVLEVIDRETTAIEALYSQDTIKQVNLLSNYAHFYSDIHKYHRAAHLFQKVSDVYVKLLQEADARITLYEVSNILHHLAFCLGEQQQYARAEKLFYFSAELKEQYLGSEHPDLILTLDYRSRCLHHLGKHDEEATIRARIAKLDREFAYHDEHEEHGPKCPWHRSDCPRR